MASDIWQPKIRQYVDGELSEVEMRAMEGHLRECTSCAAEALRQLQMKHTVKAGARRYTPSPEFRRKITDQVAASKPAAWRWVWAPAMAVALAVLVVAGFLLQRSFQRARSRQLLTELTDIHVSNLAAASPVDVLSSDRHTVKPWFQGKLPFTFNLPELEGAPFALVGGRLTYLNHEPGAHLIYDAGAHHISVFIFRDQPELRAFPPEARPADVLKFNVQSWSSHGLRYFVVGDANDLTMNRIVGLLKEAGES
jgi:anti-sigma factor RsiW